MPYLLLFIGIILFIISILVLFFQPLTSLDLTIVENFSTLRTEPINKFAILLSALGGMPFVLFLTCLWCFHRAWYKKYKDVIFIGLGVVGSIASVWLLKFLISRPRPPEMFHLVTSYGASFPSAHSMYAATLACLAIFLSRPFPAHRFIVCIALLWMLMMGISRVYLGVHFPSDVLAGWSISIIWISLLYIMYGRYNQSNTNYF
ncbi:phosphatase PAP2 family protein [Acinetobacter sp. BSP-153]|uniref:phosphatase PAP2 family protein n=1 Tax=unclassified Acinetobacter TaxID=196816 RepID=UPI000A34ED7D|nr:MULTISPECIES: phosphatase PAP2 family protein [unclassified Acinetobacter]OTG61438.1 phosphatidylglycerophosphatase [Acinetobacter sp. ANC 4204]